MRSYFNGFFISLMVWITFSCSQRAYMNMPIPFATFDTCKQVALGGSVAINFKEVHASYAISNRWMVHGSYLSSISRDQQFYYNGENLKGASQNWEMGAGIWAKRGDLKFALTANVGQGFCAFETVVRQQSYYRWRYLLSNRQHNIGLCAQLSYLVGGNFSTLFYLKPTFVDFEYFSFEKYDLSGFDGKKVEYDPNYRINENHLQQMMVLGGVRMNIIILKGLLYLYQDYSYSFNSKKIESRFPIDLVRPLFPTFNYSIGLQIVLPSFGKKLSLIK